LKFAKLKHEKHSIVFNNQKQTGALRLFAVFSLAYFSLNKGGDSDGGQGSAPLNWSRLGCVINEKPSAH
jgi:hypothetical protein